MQSAPTGKPKRWFGLRREQWLVFALLGVPFVFLSSLPGWAPYVWGLAFCAFLAWICYSAMADGGGRAYARFNVKYSIAALAVVFILVIVLVNTGDVGKSVLEVSQPLALVGFIAWSIVVFAKTRKARRARKL